MFKKKSVSCIFIFEVSLTIVLIILYKIGVNKENNNLFSNMNFMDFFDIFSSINISFLGIYITYILSRKNSRLEKINDRILFLSDKILFQISEIDLNINSKKNYRMLLSKFQETMDSFCNVQSLCEKDGKKWFSDICKKFNDAYYKMYVYCEELNKNVKTDKSEAKLKINKMSKELTFVVNTLIENIYLEK